MTESLCPLSSAIRSFARGTEIGIIADYLRDQGQDELAAWLTNNGQFAKRVWRRGMKPDALKDQHRLGNYTIDMWIASGRSEDFVPCPLEIARQILAEQKEHWRERQSTAQLVLNLLMDGFPSADFTPLGMSPLTYDKLQSFNGQSLYGLPVHVTPPIEQLMPDGTWDLIAPMKVDSIGPMLYEKETGTFSPPGQQSYKSYLADLRARVNRK